MKKISVVTGVYNEEDLVDKIYQTIKSQLTPLLKKYKYEHIFVDNCSTDSTQRILKKIAKNDVNIKLIFLSRNFGPEKSGFTGLIHTSGDFVIPYEGNMKDPPELIPTFIKHWENGYELVMGVRKATKDTWLMSVMRKLFYKIIHTASSENLPMNYGSYGLIDKKIINILKTIDDYNPYIRGLIATSGFKRITVEYSRRERKNKHSKTSLPYLFDFAINALISYSITPIRFCTYLGVGLSTLSLVTAAVYLFLKLFYWKVTVPGVSAAILLILFFSGIQLLFLGLIGEYIGAIHSQVRKKPFVIINEKINFS
jgi:glycosyltransferase involved in cell wall biosynthesis